MNTHEIYVSLETAKLLKKAGFDWECMSYYNINDVLYETWQNIAVLYNYNDEKEFPFKTSAPTLSVAQRWLREEKGIDVFIFPTFGLSNYKWVFRSIIDMELPKCEIIFPVYEEALEAGIKKCLELILEKDE